MRESAHARFHDFRVIIFCRASVMIISPKVDGGVHGHRAIVFLSFIDVSLVLRPLPCLGTSRCGALPRQTVTDLRSLA